MYIRKLCFSNRLAEVCRLTGLREIVFRFCVKYINPGGRAESPAGFAENAACTARVLRRIFCGAIPNFTSLRRPRENCVKTTRKIFSFCRPACSAFYCRAYRFFGRKVFFGGRYLRGGFLCVGFLCGKFWQRRGRRAVCVSCSFCGMLFVRAIAGIFRIRKLRKNSMGKPRCDSQLKKICGLKNSQTFF